MNKLEEIEDRLDAVGLIVSLIIQAAVSHQHELPRLTQGDSGAESPLRADLGSRRIAVNPSLIVKEVPEYDPAS